jgi:hypothetical protein
MKPYLRAAILMSASLSVLSMQGVAGARTTGPTLSEQVEAYAPTTQSVVDATAKGDALGDVTQARLSPTRVCHISRHPRDGIPASIHACPLVFAAGDAVTPEAPLRAD